MVGFGRRLAATLTTALAVGGLTSSCAHIGPPSGAVGPCQRNAAVACTDIDGYPVGSLAQDCGPEGAACGDIALLARLALDAREPNHPEITSVQQFDPDLSKICGQALCTFSSTQAIVVFTFADGQHHATGYQCAGVHPCVGTLTWMGWDNAIAQPEPMTQTRLVLLCGLPASGKTTLARELADAYGAVRLNPDEWEASLGVDTSPDQV